MNKKAKKMQQLVNSINCLIHCHRNTWVSKSSMIDAIATTPAIISPKAKENIVRHAEVQSFNSLILGLIPAGKLHHIMSCQMVETNNQQIIINICFLPSRS